FGLGWHYEAGLEWIRLAAAGVFDELPELQIILGHWGEVVLFYLERTSAVMERALDLDQLLIEYARRNLYVTGSGMWSATYLQQCLDIVGPERLLFSTDFPYQYREGGEPRRFLETV
ncbi:amidohydrolase family protein, partial [Mycobacterium tuberculosis]